MVPFRMVPTLATVFLIVFSLFAGLPDFPGEVIDDSSNLTNYLLLTFCAESFNVSSFSFVTNCDLGDRLLAYPSAGFYKLE